MANMSFGVNIIPKQNNTYTLGNSDYKWNIFANTINGQSIDGLGLPTVSSTDNGKILQVSSGTWAAVSSPDLSIYATKANPTFTGTFNFGRYPQTTVGTSSITLGYEVIASGIYSCAQGRNTTASGDTSHTEGLYTVAAGQGSHAEGEGGNFNTSNANVNSGAYSYYSHSEGSITRAEGQGAHSEGGRTYAKADYTHSEGYGTEALKDYSHAEGHYTIANAIGAHTEGYETTASALATYAHSEGYQTTVHGEAAHVEGKYTIANGNYSHAEGIGGTYSDGTNDITSQAYGTADHTEGYETRTNSGQSNQPGNHAEGYRTSATGGAAHAEGSDTIAAGINSHAEGLHTIATGNYSHVEGYYTNADGNYGHAEGTSSHARGPAAHAEGSGTEALGTSSHAEGVGTITMGPASHAGGQYNVADSYDNWPTWTASTSYIVGDKVKYSTTSNNVTTTKGYICKTAHTSGSTFSTTNWNTDYMMNYITIIGNGESSGNRSNAYALDWDGNAFFKGNVYVGANADSSGGSKLATEAYVTTAIANAGGGSSGSTPSNLATVATTGDYGDLINKPDLSQYITAVPTMTGCSSSAAGASGLVPAPAAGNEDQFLSGDGTWKSGGLPMVILSYGNSTWAQFEAAYKNNVIVYCRASSNSNPASGSQTRMAFMAYVNDGTNPTNVEFQYYRSVNAHSSTQMGDQVFVYKLDKTSGWSVTTREASIKQIEINTASAGSIAWSNNKVTLTTGLPKVSASDNGKILQVVNGVWTAVTPS